MVRAGQAGDLKVQFTAHVGDDPLRSQGVLSGVTGALPQGYYEARDFRDLI